MDYLGIYIDAIELFAKSKAHPYSFEDIHFDQLVDKVELFYTLYDKDFNAFAKEQLCAPKELMFDETIAKASEKMATLENAKIETEIIIKEQNSTIEAQDQKLNELPKEFDSLKTKNTRTEKILGLIKKCFIITMILLPVIFLMYRYQRIKV